MFLNRADAGEKLAAKLGPLGRDTIILGLPRGGVIVAHEVAKALKATLDVIVTKKLGAPGDSEFAIGAVGMSTVVLNDEAKAVGKAYIDSAVRRLRGEIKERLRNLRGDRPMPALKGKTVILVDDGMATGASMEAAVKEVTTHKPKQVIVAVPVAPEDAVRRLSKFATVVCLEMPDPFYAVGNFYRDFDEVTEDDCKRHLK